MSVILNSEEDFHKYICQSRPIVIDFHAKWCGPCKAIAPLFEDMAKKYPNILFLKIDVDAFPTITKSVGVSAMPTFLFIKDNIKYGEIKGADKNKLIAYITDFSVGKLSLVTLA